MIRGLVVPPELREDPDVRRELAELESLFEENPLERYNHPELPNAHQKQMEFHAAQVGPLGTKLLLASNRSGKTVCGVVDDIIQLLPESFVPEHLKPFKKWNEPITIWVGAPKNENHFNNTIPLFRKFLPRAALTDGAWRKSFKSQPNPRLVLANGSEVAFKTYDQDLDAWAGAEIHRVHWDEEPNGANAKELRAEGRYRRVSTGGDEIVTMTPVLGAYSWVNDEVWERRTEPNIFAMKMKIWDNPWNDKEVVKQIIEEAKAEGTEAYRTRIEAEFVHLGGLFFEEFRDFHVVDPITPDHLKGQEVVIGIDPGRQRTGVVWVAFDNDNSALVFDEFNPTEMVVPDVAAHIRERNAAWGIKDARYVIDPSSRNTTSINADNVESAYARQEIYVEHGQNSRPAGILEMKRRLQAKTDGKPNPELLFTRGVPNTIEQIRRYAKDPKAQDEWAAVPQTSRVRFDLVDATRYAVMARTWEFAEAAPEHHKPAYQPNWEPPFSTRQFISDPPPFGDYS